MLFSRRPVTRPIMRLASRHAPALCATLFFTFGLIAAMSSAARGQSTGDEGLFLTPPDVPGVRVRAPVVAATADIVINGLTGRTIVRQTFLNPEEGWVEGVYKFPLPAGAAVDRMRLRVNERTIEGVIAERQAARKRYRAAVSAGQRASLLEQERPNLFTMSVANIPPKGRIEVEIAYQQMVDHQDGRYSIRFPMAVTPRYMSPPNAVTGVKGGAASPAAGQSDRVTFPVRRVEAPKTNPVAIRVRLDPGMPLETLESVSHKLMVAETVGGVYDISLKAGAVPSDRDFVLDWTLKTGETPAPALFVEEVDGAAYLLAMIVPPKEYQKTAVQRPREVIFVIDTSGSMHGTSMRQAREALLFGLGRLKAADRFNVVAFSDKTRPLFTASRAADAASLDAARSFVGALEADGGTEIGGALALALAGDNAAGRLRQVVLLTDGAVGNEPELLARLRQRIGDSRLFTVAIGNAPNGYFMREAARVGRGAMMHVSDVSRVRTRITALFAKLERPALTDIQAVFPSTRAAAVLPSPIPDLYFGEPLVLTARLPDAGGELRLMGRNGRSDWRFAAALKTARPGHGIAKLWARAKVDREMGRLRSGADPDTVRLAVLDIALRHGILTDYTSLVAIDREAVRAQDQRLDERKVPSNPPAGWTPPHRAPGDKAMMRRAGPQRQATGSQDSGLKLAAATQVPTVSLGVQSATPAAALLICGVLALFSVAMLWLIRRRIAA